MFRIDEEAFTLSEPKKTWNEWWQQKQRHFTTAKYYKGKHRFLLGLYAFSHFLFYPLLAAAIVFFRWEFAVGSFLYCRCIIQGIIWYKAMGTVE